MVRNQNVRLLLNLIPDRIFLLDKKGVIIDYQGPENPFYDMSKEEFIGKRYKDILPPKIVRQLDKTIKKAFLTQKIEKCRLHIPEKGEYKRFECRVNPKNIDYVLVILREIETVDRPNMTYRKRLKKEILKKKVMLETVMEGITEPILIIDEKYNIRIINTSCGRYLKLNTKKRKALGKCYSRIFKKGRVCENCVASKVISEGKSYSIKRKRGDRIENVMFYPLFLKKGEIDGVMIFIKDITEEAEKERQMLQTDRMTTLGTLVSAVAHEINNPNNFIILNIPIIKELWKEVIPILDKYQQEYEDFTLAGMSYREIRNEIPSIITYIEEGSKRIQKIVQNLKDYARIPSNEIDKKVNINDVLKNAIMLLGNQIKKATKHFIVNLKEDIPDVKGNFQNLEQVFINLIQNACQALTDPNQKIEVNSFYDKEKKNIIVKIKDEGIGISEDLLPKIMEPFFTTKAKRGGTGLGLSVAKNIVQRHAGKIDVQSKYKEGSTFSVILPSYDAKKLKKILIIDDDKDIRNILRSAFESEGGYKVLEASSAIEASFILSQEMPDLIILDIMMPHINGVEVCRLLKDEERFRDVKVIIITGYPTSKELAQVKEMGFKEIFEKPLSIKELLKRVEELIK